MNLKIFSDIKKKFEVKNYKNPLLFDIEKYIGKKREPSGRIFPIENKFMKFGEHFFVYFLASPYQDVTIDYHSIISCLYIFYTPIFAMTILMIWTAINENQIVIAIIISIVIIAIPMLVCLLHYWCSKCQFHDARIDFIYSKDFDRIFIGIVNYNQKKYSKTFEYQLDEIERFFFQLPEIINGDSTLSIELKSKRIVHIQRFKFLDKFDQEGLEYILNEKINNVTAK